MKLKYVAVLAAGVMLSGAAAADYPDRSIRLLVGYTPGGAADNVARIFSKELSEKLGQPVVVENRPGAGSTIASAALARATPDGYTLGMASGTLYGIDEYIYNVSYSPDDFTPINRLSMSPLILAVGKESDINSFEDFMKKVKEKPGEMFYSSSGIGGSPQVSSLMLENVLGAQFTHVPYKGGNPALLAVASGDVDFSFGTAASVLALAQGEQVKMLGISSVERSQLAPDVPTIVEQGLPDFEFVFWFGLFGPAGLPDDIRDKLSQATLEIMSDPDVEKRMIAAGNEAAPMESSEAFRKWAAEYGGFALERLRSTETKPN